MKKILYLPIETIAREFDARMLIAHQALARGYYVITGQKDNVYKAGNIIGEGIYFYKSHGAANFPKNKRVDFRFITLDEEGLVFVDDNEYLRNSKPRELDHLDIVFTWGSYQKGLLVNVNPGLEGKTVAVGNTRFDLLRPEFRSLYGSLSKKLKNRWGNYMIINTRFAPGNFSRLYGCSYVDSRKYQFEAFIGRRPAEDELDFLKKEASYYEELFYQYVDMLKVVSKRFPAINFILRPHPSEDLINWKEALKGLKNVHVIFKGTAVDWILEAICVIHTGCTTGIEAWALKKPVIAYNPNKKTGIEPPLPNKFGLKIDNIDELCRAIDSIIEGRFRQDHDRQLDTAKPFIESITGDYSVTRFMDAVDNIIDEKSIKLGKVSESDYSKLERMENIKGTIKIVILKLLSRYQPFIKKVFGKKIYRIVYGYFDKYPGLFAQFKKFPGLKSKEIKYKLSIYDKIFYKKPTEGYFIKKIATDTYIIGKK
jgi:surface carbohydrate biosynthesis protein